LLLLFSCTICSVYTTDSESANVIVLNDSNFEHLTQAASGATTGDWFIDFYSPHCGHCKQLDPIWRNVAEKLRGGTVVVAKIDASNNRITKERFRVSGYPTILFLKAGKRYTYQGQRDVKSLVAFANGGYTKAITQDVPPELSLFDRFFGEAKEDVVYLFEYKKSAVAVVFVAGLVVGFILCVVVSWICSPRKTKRA